VATSDALVLLCVQWRDYAPCGSEISDGGCVGGLVRFTFSIAAIEPIGINSTIQGFELRERAGQVREGAGEGQHGAEAFT
jgi:hypothetical protein